tara:strand:- start:94 stop:246 length:153 start_codon:yes stop_codon:yes gene_type:complete
MIKSIKHGGSIKIKEQTPIHDVLSSAEHNKGKECLIFRNITKIFQKRDAG